MKELTRFEVAQLAWQNAREGLNENFHGYRVVKGRRSVVVIPPLDTWKKFDAVFVKHDITVYPHPDHGPVFQSAVSRIAPHGPAESFPGAVGTIGVKIALDYKTRRPEKVWVNYAQA